MIDNIATGMNAAAKVKPPAMAIVVGDLSSDERGSGARANGGKTPYHLIPVWILARAWGDDSEAGTVLRFLGEWQRSCATIDDVLGEFSLTSWANSARVFEYGAQKYDSWNWAKGMPWSVPTGCAVRHLLAAIYSGADLVDPESSHTHLGHVLCNVVMLAQYEISYREGDDRPVKWINPHHTAL